MDGDKEKELDVLADVVLILFGLGLLMSGIIIILTHFVSLGLAVAVAMMTLPIALVVWAIWWKIFRAFFKG